MGVWLLASGFCAIFAIAFGGKAIYHGAACKAYGKRETWNYKDKGIELYACYRMGTFAAVFAFMAYMCFMISQGRGLS